MSEFGSSRTQWPYQNDDRFRMIGRHTSPLRAFSTSNFKLGHYPEPPGRVVESQVHGARPSAQKHREPFGADLAKPVDSLGSRARQKAAFTPAPPAPIC